MLLFKGSQFKRLGPRRAAFARKVEKLARTHRGEAADQLARAATAAEKLKNHSIAAIYDAARGYLWSGEATRPKRNRKSGSRRRSKR